MVLADGHIRTVVLVAKNEEPTVWDVSAVCREEQKTKKNNNNKKK